MFKRNILLFLVLLLCCSATAETVLTDMKGRTVTIDEPVNRVVALTPADCEILCALGCEDALVGVGAYCDYPASVMNLPKVNSGAETNLEEIIALEPQVVLMGDMAQTEEQVRALEESGIRVVVSDANDLDGVYAAIRLTGELMNRTEEAEVLISDMRAVFDEIAAQAKPAGKTVYFEVSPLEWGLWTAGKNTFMDELATLCGLTNAFADVDGWASVSEEQVLERDPDYIVTIAMYDGDGQTPVEEIMCRKGWENLKAVTGNRVLNADSNEISRPGPRLKDAAMTLYEFCINQK